MDMKYFSLPMVCACGDRRAQADELREKALSTLKVRDNFLSHFVYYVCDRGGTIDVVADMWMSIAVTFPEFQLSVEADRAEDGLAALYLWLLENGPAEED
jgi:hypothetical protein